MVKNCVAAGCKSTCRDTVSFFKFQSDDHCREQWIRQVRRTRDRWNGPSKHGYYFDRGGISADLLSDVVLDLNLSVCDLHYRESVKFTYERDDGLVRSWIDHILCSQAISILVTDIYTLQSGVNLSDHLPLFFKLHINHSSHSSFPATASSKPICID